MTLTSNALRGDWRCPYLLDQGFGGTTEHAIGYTTVGHGTKDCGWSEGSSCALSEWVKLKHNRWCCQSQCFLVVEKFDKWLNTARVRCRDRTWVGNICATKSRDAAWRVTSLKQSDTSFLKDANRALWSSERKPVWFQIPAQRCIFVGLEVWWGD